MPEAWSRAEVEATVSSYFAMLERVLRGESYNGWGQIGKMKNSPPGAFHAV